MFSSIYYIVTSIRCLRTRYDLAQERRNFVHFQIDSPTICHFSEPLLILSFFPTAEVVAQFKYTVLIMPTGVNLVTGLDFAPEQYQSEHSITDAELKVRLIRLQPNFECKTKWLHCELHNSAVSVLATATIAKDIFEAEQLPYSGSLFRNFCFEHSQHPNVNPRYLNLTFRNSIRGTATHNCRVSHTKVPRATRFV